MDIKILGVLNPNLILKKIADPILQIPTLEMNDFFFK